MRRLAQASRVIYAEQAQASRFIFAGQAQASRFIYAGQAQASRFIFAGQAQASRFIYAGQASCTSTYVIMMTSSATLVCDIFWRSQENITHGFSDCYQHKNERAYYFMQGLIDIPNPEII